MKTHRLENLLCRAAKAGLITPNVDRSIASLASLRAEFDDLCNSASATAFLEENASVIAHTKGQLAAVDTETPHTAVAFERALQPAEMALPDPAMFPPAAVKGALAKALANAAPKQYQQPTRLNLIYHVCPFAANDVWKWNLAQLKQRLPAFNGRIVVSIATGAEFADPEEVKSEFGEAASRITFLTFPNDTDLRDAVSWPSLLRHVQSTDPREATFYAHARGVSRPQEEATHTWTLCMYRHCLDDVPAIQTLLESHPSAGVSFRRMTPGFHYPGTFFWFRHNRVFTRDGWDVLTQGFVPDVGLGWTVEAFPNRFFKFDAGCIYPAIRYDRHHVHARLYKAEFWNESLGATEEVLPSAPGSLGYHCDEQDTDKNSTHSYIPFYEKLFTPLRSKPITLVEFGVRAGGSLWMWRNYFSVARIVGIDIVPFEVNAYAGIDFELADACEFEPFWTDVVIDDASHELPEQVAAFKRWWPKVRPGGYYIIEDVQSDGACDALLAVHPFEAEDLRAVKGRYDDVILWAQKP